MSLPLLYDKENTDKYHVQPKTALNKSGVVRFEGVLSNNDKKSYEESF